MESPPPTLIWRHRKERLSKCSLRGLEHRYDIEFFTYPRSCLPDLSRYLLLTPEGTPLTAADAPWGVLLLDGTWRYAKKMHTHIPTGVPRRALPKQIATAYPRRQSERQGLASIEALFVAYHTLQRSTEGLLDHYQWAQRFLDQNGFIT